jgi:hypothetical protein
MAVCVILLLAVGAVFFFRAGNSVSPDTTRPGPSVIGAASGTQYANRLTHIRNGPTSIGTVVLSDVQAGEAVSGVWVMGHDGVTKWLRITRRDGSAGFLCSSNLSPVAPSRPLSSTIGDFAAYPVPVYSGAPASPDFVNSSASFRRFRTVIREGASRGVNFAGHYSVITIGCGTDCSSTLVVDDRSGAIFGFPLGGEDYYGLNLTYRADSLLIVAQWQDNQISPPDCVQEDFLLAGTTFNVLHQRRSPGACPL